MTKHDSARKCYRTRPTAAVTAIQLKLKTDGLHFEKWGDHQLAKANDWLVENDGDCYTVANHVFARTYRKISEGRFVKHTYIWAYQASEAGRIETLEGSTTYSAGDYLVSNDPDDAADVYAVDKATFEKRYILHNSDDSEHT